MFWGGLVQSLVPSCLEMNSKSLAWSALVCGPFKEAVCACVCMCVSPACRGQENLSDPLELESQAVVSHLT